ncbi:TPA: hypothetical protein N0F65_006997 [Lagenidium giganteum]|uniref:HRDC domain-containing protein n=1 Tax=Lagenidium giganteum TaxID=4803 RepID=A0AAV2ZHC3_9STRA|nr:TPA: hypothetical protein N0F65_006997 [Lagenidium giganteum]
MDATASKAFVDALYRKVLLSVKASNAIPTEDEDYHYHTRFSRSFASRATATQEHIQGVVWNVVNGDSKNDDDDDDDDAEDAARELFDGPEPHARITDFVDTLLDEASKQLELFKAGGSDRKDAAGLRPLENKPHNFDQEPESRRSRKGGEDATLQQTKGATADQFEERVDNSDAPFVCKLREKPHALEGAPAGGDDDLDDESRGHPYFREVTSLKYLDWQLEASKNPYKKVPVEDASYLWVHTEETLAHMMASLSKSETQVVAIDLEHHSYRSYLGIVCLMQISTATEDFLVDTLALRSKLQVLNHVFCDPAKVKVLHGADMDILWLQRDLGLYIVNMFDTGQAARLLQYPRFSLAYLLKRHCGVDADKQYQLADWRLRPLDRNMIKYAREDTRYLLYIYDQMKQELLGQSDTSRASLLFETLQNSNKLCLQVFKKPEVSEEDCIALSDKLKGTVGIPVLSELQRRVFAELYYWRDRVAREQDESTGFVLPNNVLMKITKYLPTKSDQLFRTCNPVPALVRKYAHELTTMIANEKNRVAAEEAKAASSDGSGTPQKPKRGDADDDDITMESPALANIKQLCEYAGWQSGQRKAKTSSDSSANVTVGLRLSFADVVDDAMEVDETAVTSLERVNELVASTPFMLTENDVVMSGGVVDKQDSTVTQPAEDEVAAVADAIPKSISEIYQMSNRSKKRKKVAAATATKERAEDFMKQIGWANAKSDAAADKKAPTKAFDYGAASEKVKTATKEEPRGKKKGNASKGGYNPFVAVRGGASKSSTTDASEPKGAKKPLKKKHHMPRSATFK